MASERKRVLILFSMAGRGHLSAAMAIRDELVARNGNRVEVLLDDPVTGSNRLSRAMVGLYNLIVRHCPAVYRLYAGFLDFSRPHVSDRFRRKASGYLRALFTGTEPDLVVSVYPMTNHIPLEILRATFPDRRIPFLVFNTDPFGRFLRAWINPAADSTLSCSPLNAKTAKAIGLPGDRLALVRFPLRTGFPPAAASQDRGRGGITLVFSGRSLRSMGGAAGLRSLAERRPVNLVCGSDQGMYQSLKGAFPGGRIRVFGECGSLEMASLLGESAYLFGKVGAATFFECLACRVIPIVDISRGVMPQEQDILDILVGEGMGFVARDLRGVCDHLDALPDPGLYLTNLERVRKPFLGYPSVADILGGYLEGIP